MSEIWRFLLFSIIWEVMIAISLCKKSSNCKIYSTGEKLMKFNVNPNNMDSSNLCQYWLKHTKENISYCCIDRSSLHLLWTARCLCMMNLMIDLVLECHDLKKSLLSVLAFVRFLVHYSRTQLEKLGTHLRKTFSSWWIIVYLAKPWKTSESV